MKILILTGSLAQGGAERQITILARSMAELGHQVGIAVMYPGGAFESELASSKVQVFPLNKRGRWDVAHFFLELQKLVTIFHPDILQTFLTVPNIIGSLLRPWLGRTRLVWGVRNSNMDLSHYDTLSRFCAKLEALMSRSCDLAIANSHAGVRAHIDRGVRPKRFEVVENGIDTERFKWRQDQRTKIRTIWEIPETAKLCLAVGRIDPMKDHETLLQSMRRWPTDSLLAIVGSGAPSAMLKLRAAIKELGFETRVRLVGSMGDVENAYSAADALVLPSAFGEGFPNVVAEAMSCGLRVVATDVGDVRRIVGGCGQTVPPRDPEALGRAIADALCEQARYDDPRARIVSNYSVPKMVELTLQYYGELMSSKMPLDDALP